MSKKKITAEDLEKHPDWKKRGLKVGDDVPADDNRETNSDEETEEEDGEGGGGNHPGKPGNP